MPTLGRRRALGQHFLRDTSIAHLIAETAVREAETAECRTLLEIGPGKGAITLPILEISRESRIEHVILCERDRRLAEDWQAHPQPEGPQSTTLTVEEADFLDLPEEQWLGHAPLAVASNLPYSAGTAILTRLARHPDRIPVMVLMFQAEVAQRLRAEPGTKAWGSLSIWVQNRWDVSRLASVPPRAFAPPPDVQSEVVVLKARPEPRIPVPLTGKRAEQWEQLLKVGFAHRRKMLRSGLPNSGPFREALLRSGIDPTLRAEALSWEAWEKFARALWEVTPE